MFHIVIVVGKKLLLNLNVIIFGLIYLLPDGRNKMSVPRVMMMVCDDAGSFFEVATLVDLFDGGEVSTHDELGGVDHFLEIGTPCGDFAMEQRNVETRNCRCWCTRKERQSLVRQHLWRTRIGRTSSKQSYLEISQWSSKM